MDEDNTITTDAPEAPGEIVEVTYGDRDAVSAS